jgi:hypothetical protein
MDKGLQNAYIATFFGSFGAKSLSGGRKLIHNIYGNPNSPWANKIFFLNLYKVYNLYILTPKISRPFWWILGLKYVLIDMWANDQNEMMFLYFQS